MISDVEKLIAESICKNIVNDSIMSDIILKNLIALNRNVLVKYNKETRSYLEYVGTDGSINDLFPGAKDILIELVVDSGHYINTKSQKIVDKNNMPGGKGNLDDAKESLIGLLSDIVTIKKDPIQCLVDCISFYLSDDEKTYQCVKQKSVFFDFYTINRDQDLYSVLPGKEFTREEFEQAHEIFMLLYNEEHKSILIDLYSLDLCSLEYKQEGPMMALINDGAEDISYIIRMYFIAWIFLSGKYENNII